MKRALPLTLALALHLPLHAADELHAVHTQAQFEAALASGQPTPLDALTPYGRQRFLRGLNWGPKGLTGFNYVPLVRELDAGQAGAVLRFLDLEEYGAGLAEGLAGAPLRLPAPSADVVQRLQSLEDFNRDVGRQRLDTVSTTLGTPAVLQRYQRNFADRMGPEAVARQPLGDLLPLFDAAVLANFENPGSPAFDQMLLVHAELTARGIDTRRTLDGEVLRALLAARRFGPARDFAAARPYLDAKSIPHVADTLTPGFRGRSVFEYDAARNALTRLPVPSPAGAELVMVVSASCHFSVDALDAIGKDTDLQERLRAAHLLLLTPPNEAPSLRFVAGWNAVHATLPMRIPFDAREWQAIDVAGVPAFYLFKNGKVIAQHRGWAGVEDRAALLKLLDAAGR
jgi:hypothetical protein